MAASLSWIGSDNMKRLFCVTFSIFLLIALLPVVSVADLGEDSTTEQQPIETFEYIEPIAEIEDDSGEDVEEIPDETSESTLTDSDIPADEESVEEDKSSETAKEENEESNYYTETMSLSPDIEAAIFQIRDNLLFLNYGVIPLICSSVMAYLFYKFVMNTF